MIVHNRTVHKTILSPRVKPKLRIMPFSRNPVSQRRSKPQNRGFRTFFTHSNMHIILNGNSNPKYFLSLSLLRAIFLVGPEATRLHRSSESLPKTKAQHIFISCICEKKILFRLLSRCFLRVSEWMCVCVICVCQNGWENV